MRPITIAALFVFFCTVARGGEPAFAKKPSATKAGGKVKITFAVAAPTDVEVAILDAKGQVARHLAAGLLGKNAPAPLKKGSLSQSLEWDFKDDYGKKLPAGAYTVRVSLGIKPEFDKMLGSNPNTLSTICGLATNSEGELFILNLGSALGTARSTMCNVFDRSGKYKRTIMPYQASCLPDKARAFKVLDLGEKGCYPWIHASHLKIFYPFTTQPNLQRPLIMPDGRMILTMQVAGKGTMLVAVNSKDGSAPKTGFLGPAFRKEINNLYDWMPGYACLAVSPDGETIYISGIASQQRYKKIAWKHAVYRVKWGEKVITPFIGNPDAALKGNEGFDQPKGIAVDKDGRIYVADQGNNRIAVFSPEGKLLNELPIERPYMLEVHKSSGAIYATNGTWMNHIAKFKNREASTPIYDQVIPRVRTRAKGKKQFNAFSSFTLDDSGDEPVLWIGSSHRYEVFQLYRVAEKNGKLGEFEEKGNRRGFRSVRSVKVDKRRDVLYVMKGQDADSPGRRRYFLKIDGKDGKSETIRSLSGTYDPLVPSHFTFGDDGYIYVVTGRRKIYKYDRDLKPVNYRGKDTNVMDPFPPEYKYKHHVMGRGVAVDRKGNVYLLHENVPEPHKQYGLSKWGPDGKLLKQDLISRLTSGVLSLRVDLAGNLYVGERVKPLGQVVPPDLQGKVNVAKLNRNKGKYPDNHYPIMYGSILKFPPTGGAGVDPKIEDRKVLMAYDAVVGIKGELWQYFGVGAIPAYKGCNHYVFGYCHCDGMRFDVDGYGRVFSPDGGRFRVVILDTNGNEIGFFGRYGNQDSAGPKSLVPKPDIPLAWPSAVGVSDRAIYVSDILNRRIVRVKLDHAAEETCRVP